MSSREHLSSELSCEQCTDVHKMSYQQHKKPLPAELQRALKIAVGGTSLKRVKFNNAAHARVVVLSDDYERISYHSRYGWSCMPEKIKSVEVGEILEVRSGWNTDNFNKASRKGDFAVKYQPSVCFSIIFRHPVFFHKSVDLIADNTDIQKAWVAALRHLISVKKAERLHFNEEQWLIQNFNKADSNNNGSLTFSELWGLLGNLNLEISENYGKQTFEASDIIKTRSKFGEPALDREEFLKFFRHLTTRPELETIMAKYSSGGEDFFLPEDLMQFLTVEQGFKGVTIEKCQDLIRHFEPDDENKKALLLGPNVPSVLCFRQLLLSRWGSLFNPEHSVICQDMTKPLSHYYIRSSHNTYLVGSQLSGEASVEGYVNALKMGARLVELDVWDSSEFLEPVIYHGHTLVKPIKLRSAAQVIANYAFVSSPYPVILSIENHCTIEHQKKMAQIFIEVFGDKLYRRSNPLELPRPESLKGKIIIKGKMLPSGNSALDVDQVSEEDEAVSSCSDTEQPALQSRDDEGAIVKTVRKISNQMSMKKRKTKMPLAKEFSDIVGIPSVKFRHVEQALNEHPLDSMASLSENRVYPLMEEEVEGLRVYTRDHILKSYPKAFRTDSSNMDPVPQWNAGIQVVALNMQTHGEAMDLDEGKFKVNGRTGYVLKPHCLVSTEPFVMDKVRSAKMLLRIKVISGQYLPHPDASGRGDILDPYVSVEIFGLPCDNDKQKTQVIKNNGFNPVWDKEFEFKLRAPELALLRIVVKDYDLASSNDFVGQYTLPVSSVRPGYSHMHLHTGYAHTIDASATLFVRCTVVDYTHTAKRDTKV